MSSGSAAIELTGLQKAGILVFTFLCGIPAHEVNGFRFGNPFSLSDALVCATIGGAVGGIMMCSRPILAGLVGGLLAGPLGLLAVYYYMQNRVAVWDLELVIVQLVACIPGALVGRWVKTALSGSSPESQPFAGSSLNDPPAGAQEPATGRRNPDAPWNRGSKPH